MDQQFQRALRSRVQLISMATAAPTICFTIRAHAKQQFGTSTIIYSLATLPVRPSRPAGAWPRLDRSLAAILANSSLSNQAADFGGDSETTCLLLPTRGAGELRVYLARFRESILNSLQIRRSRRSQICSYLCDPR